MMGSLVVRILGAVGAALLSATMLGSGVASADELTGKSYEDAAATISGRSGEVVIGTVSGDQLPTEECIVTSWQKSMFLDALGESRRSNEYMVHLNCNNPVATPGHPGNSSMSPAGIAAKTDQEAAANINKNPEFCEKSDENAQWCERICNRTGLCEI